MSDATTTAPCNAEQTDDLGAFLDFVTFYKCQGFITVATPHDECLLDAGIDPHAGD